MPASIIAGNKRMELHVLGYQKDNFPLHYNYVYSRALARAYNLIFFPRVKEMMILE